MKLNEVGQAVTEKLRVWPPPVEGAISNGKGKEAPYMLIHALRLFSWGRGDMSCMVQLGLICQNYSNSICGK